MILGALSPDLYAPAGTITLPGAGSTQGGVIVPTINATDDHGVLGVQWKVDGINYGGEVVSAPFSAPALDTRNMNDIGHTISATVRDVVNHTTTVTQGFNVNNNPNPGGALVPGSSGNWNPTGGTGRRYYNFSEESGVGIGFSTSNYYDSNGDTWPGNAMAPHYKIQGRYLVGDQTESGAQGFESINGPQSEQNHVYALGIGPGAGQEIFRIYSHPSRSYQDSGWFDVPNSVSGPILWHDWTTTGAGGTAYTGVVQIYYRYVWIG